MTNLPKANKGQGVLESVLVLPVAVAFITLLFFSSYRAMVYFYADHALHEAMICTYADSISFCENEFAQKIKRLTLKNENVSIRLSKSGGQIRYRLNGIVEITSPLKNSGFELSRFLKIQIRKQMQFPLKGSS
ncbi:hypothetical protein [Bdellovibrio sp. HCB274]|uniref:hypothetical protein n=1 Tax=Bdellovibrio sp. HCB274 TaxID=3394361 RepID=UPI0039B4FA65